MAISRSGIKSKLLSRSEKLNMINKVDCVPVSHHGELGICVKKVTGQML
jgi:hypothetical protein